MLSAVRFALVQCRFPGEGFVAACSTSSCQQLGLTTALTYLQHGTFTISPPHSAAQQPVLATLTTHLRHLSTLRLQTHAPKKNRTPKLSFPRNDQITAPQVRVVLPSGETKVMDTPTATQLARSGGLDLVQTYFDPNKPDVPPVAKILHFGAFIAEQRSKVAQQLLKKQEQEAAAAESSKSKPIKEIKFNVQIADHDLEVKLRKVINLLDDGYKVMVVVNCKKAAEKQPAEQALEYIIARLQKLKEVEVAGRVAAPRMIHCVVKAK